MENIEYFNPNKIIKIVLVDKAESDWFKIKRDIKLFGITIRKCGIYNRLHNLMEENEVYKTHLLIDGIIYEKPYVKIYFDSDISKTFYFNDYENGREHIHRFSKKYNLETITKYLFN